MSNNQCHSHTKTNNHERVWKDKNFSFLSRYNGGAVKVSNSDWALHDIEKHSNLLTSTRTQNLCIHPTEIKDEQLLYSRLVWIQGSKTNNTSYIRGQSKVNVVVNICKFTLTQCLGYSSTLLMKLNPFPGISL